ncbi:MAG TPA: hypothetical protein VFC78_06140 [Tepidisphaeraceae bacterium]|nr:hypothetical protein [Tepidisphaeraceae bacterium]
MVDRVVSSGLTLIVIGLITLTSGAAVACAYQILIDLFSGQLAAGSIRAAACLPFALAAAVLMRYRADLMDRS